FQSSRKVGIISLPVLSHHRTYRSVYGGSLLYTFEGVFDVVFSYPLRLLNRTYLFFGFRPILVIRSLAYEHLIPSHLVTFFYCQTARFGPSLINAQSSTMPS